MEKSGKINFENVVLKIDSKNHEARSFKQKVAEKVFEFLRIESISLNGSVSWEESEEEKSED